MHTAADVLLLLRPLLPLVMSMCAAYAADVLVLRIAVGMEVSGLLQAVLMLHMSHLLYPTVT